MVGLKSAADRLFCRHHPHINDLLRMPHPEMPQCQAHAPAHSSSRHNGHALQGVIEVFPAIAADLIASPFKGEDPAQVPMVTAKCKIQGLRQRMYEPLPDRKFLARARHHSIHPL